MDNENVVNTTPASSPNYQKIFKLVGLGIVAVILLALVISIIGALIPEKFETSGKNYIDIEQNDDGEYVLIFSGKKPVTLDSDLSDKIESQYDISSDYENKYAFVLVESEEESDDEEEASSESSELYAITSKGAKVVAEDVETYMLSSLGDTLLYITYEGDLYVGEVSKPDKAKKIDSDVSFINALSPDGSAFAYTCYDEDAEEPEAEVFISENGKKGEKFGKKDSTVIGISDGAKYIYYTKTNDEGESSFYVNDTKLAGEDDSVGSAYAFNRDGSQLIFSVTDDKDKTKTYIVNKAKDKAEIEEGSLENILTPSGAIGYSGSFPACNVSSFAKCAVMIGENYYYLKNVKGDAEKLGELKNADSVKLLDDGETVIFIKNGSLRTCDITKPSKAATEYESEDDIVGFTCTSDGEDIFVRDENDTLYYVKGKSNMKKIAEDVSRARAVKGGKVYFINEDDELFYAKKSGSSKKVIDDVAGIYYYEEADDVFTKTEDTYYSVSGKKAKKIFNIG